MQPLGFLQFVGALILWGAFFRFVFLDFPDNPMSKKPHHTPPWLSPWVLLPLLFIVGLILATGFECPEILSRNRTLGTICFLPDKAAEVFHKIGEAFMIAAVLAAVVDEDLKSKLITDSSRFISGRNLPPILRDYLHDYLSSPFVRARWDIKYTIKEWPEHRGYIKLITRSEYVMENHSRHRALYDFAYEVEKSLDSSIGKTEITAIELPGSGRVTGQALADAILEENEYVRYPRNPQSLRLKPVKSGEIYTFASESIECFRDTQYSYFWAMHPVLVTTLIVNYPKNDFRVSLELTFEKNDVAIKEELTDGTKWTINMPILPGQGFVARWDRKTIESDASKMDI